MRTKTLHEHNLTKQKTNVEPLPIFSHKKNSCQFIFAYACSKKKMHNFESIIANWGIQ